MKFSFSCVHSYQMQNYRYLDSVHNLLFSSLFTCRCETHISRKVPKTKDFYEFTRCRQHTVSTCPVIGNISTARTFSSPYPFSHRYFKSLASVAESQLTYTIRSGPIFTMVESTLSSHPFRGGSTTTTSGLTPLSRKNAAAAPASAHRKRALLMPFLFAQ